MSNTYKFIPLTDKRYHIARILKENREKCHISKEAVIEYLARNNIQKVSKSTIYAWENGNSAPSNDVFLELCKLYHISEILYVFGYDSMPTEHQLVNSLSSYEQRLIMAVREKPDMEPIINKLLDIKQH